MDGGCSLENASLSSRFETEGFPAPESSLAHVSHDDTAPAPRDAENDKQEVTQSRWDCEAWPGDRASIRGGRQRGRRGNGLNSLDHALTGECRPLVALFKHVLSHRFQTGLALCKAQRCPPAVHLGADHLVVAGPPHASLAVSRACAAFVCP